MPTGVLDNYALRIINYKRGFMKRVLMTGGGSGGHVMPAIATIDLLKKASSDIDILYVGSKKGIERELIGKRGDIPYKSISTGKLRRYFSWDNMLDMFRVVKGVFDALFVVMRYKPNLIFSTGGFVGVPVVVAGAMLRVPVVIHEQTVDAGLANKIASRFASKVALTFEESRKFFPSSKTVVTGIPLRDSIFNVDKTEAMRVLDIDENLPVVYVSGGGLGCHILNVTVLQIIKELLPRMTVILQTGNADNGEDYRKAVECRASLPSELQRRFHVYNFIDNVGEIFAVTDLAVARSGAGTVNELIALGKPAVFVPLAIATGGEQLKNANVMVNFGGAEVILESELDETILTNTIENIIFGGKLGSMRESLAKIKNFRGNDAVQKLLLKQLKLDIEEEG